MGYEQARTGGKKCSEIVLSLNFESIACLEPENFGHAPENDRNNDLSDHRGFGLGVFEHCMQSHGEEPEIPQKVLNIKYLKIYTIPTYLSSDDFVECDKNDSLQEYCKHEILSSESEAHEHERSELGHEPRECEDLGQQRAFAGRAGEVDGIIENREIVSMVFPDEMIEVRLVDESEPVLYVEQANQAQTKSAGNDTENEYFPNVPPQVGHNGNNEKNWEYP